MSENSPHAASYSAAAPQKEARSRRPGQPQCSKHGRPTHFLCFPLTTDNSIQQLCDSLSRFRSITTPLSELDSVSKSNPDIQHEDLSPAAGAVGDGSSAQCGQSAENGKALRLLPEAAHRPPGTFHLTLGTMNLSNQEDMDKALALLSEIDFPVLLRDAESGDPAAKLIKAREDVPPLQPLKSLSRAISPPPTITSATLDTNGPAKDPLNSTLTISLQSLGTFPTASSARVFYAIPSDPSDRLQSFGSLVRRRFREAGLITETRPLVLHATVANLTYVRGKDWGAMRTKGGVGRRGRNGGGEGTVDAREILKAFEEQIWAEDINISSIRICKMGAEACETPGWGMEYKAIAERHF